MSAVGGAARPTRLGRYELITRIGQGGMAEVQLALQRGPAGFEKLVVVKLVHDTLATQKAFVDMLLDEARVAALVKHPNVVDIYDLGQADGRFFIAMEYLEGEPLLAVLRAGRDGKRLDPLSTGRLIADTAEGLDAAHELRSMSGERLELVHHDISLGNIVVLYNGQVKLVDFGVAKATTAARQTKVQGKFSYMAPEKLRGAAGDRRSDIFSLGCVMWEALTLKRLFRGGNDGETMKQVLEMAIQPPSKINGDVPPEYDAIVMRALDRDPNKRHGTAKELAVEIEELLRKRGYGAKNDRIAKYMQETFKGHIDARKKLVQEVVAKGSASAEVLDAAFNDPLLAAGSPVTPVRPSSDFSVKVRRVTAPGGVPVTANAWADASRPTEISPPPIFEPERAGPPLDRTRPPTQTEIDQPPLPDEPDVAPGAAPAVASDVEATEIGGGIGPLERVKALLADRSKRPYILGGAAAVLLLLVIVIAASGGDAPATTANDPQLASHTGSGDPSGTESAGVETAAGTEDTSGRSDVGSSDANSAGSAEPLIEIDPEPRNDGADSGKPDPQDSGKDNDAPSDDTDERKHTGDDGVKHTGKDGHGDSAGKRPDPRPSPPPINVPETVQKGLMAFVKGNTREALALLQKARAAKPGYAPTYRVLGKVYQKLGDRGNAKRAFQRYLNLAPKAQDADQIREELKKL